jgi:uncharacterized protein (TIGR02246 family)
MRQVIKTTMLIAISSFLFLACTDSGTTASTEKETKPSFDLAAAKTAIEAVNADFGAFVGKSDSVSLAGLYTADAKLMGPNMPTASGRSNIQSTFAGMFSAMGQMGIKLTTLEVWGNESAVTEEGTYSITDKDGKEIDKGKYLVVWKMEDGKWKLFRDCWNSDLPVLTPAK